MNTKEQIHIMLLKIACCKYTNYEEMFLTVTLLSRPQEIRPLMISQPYPFLENLPLRPAPMWMWLSLMTLISTPPEFPVLLAIPRPYPHLIVSFEIEQPSPNPVLLVPNPMPAWMDPSFFFSAPIPIPVPLLTLFVPTLMPQPTPPFVHHTKDCEHGDKSRMICKRMFILGKKKCFRILMLSCNLPLCCSHIPRQCHQSRRIPQRQRQFRIVCKA